MPAGIPRGARAVLGAPGRQLDRDTRAFMEPRLGRDLGDVRIHDDALAARSAALVGARAYAVDHHVVFGAGEFDPAGHRGRWLLAHELAHVLQQKEGQPVVMRTALPFDSTISVHHRVLVGETRFEVGKDAVAITADARWHLSDEEADNQGSRGSGLAEHEVCKSNAYHITLNQVGRLWDSEYGTCTFPSGGPVRSVWNQLPAGRYYLTIWTEDHNPDCVLEGQIHVEELSGIAGATCTRLPPGPIETLHDGLMLAGLIPVLGAAPDLINAGIYVVQGDWVGAGFSAAVAIPFLGDGFAVARQGEKLVIRAAGKDVESLGAQRIADAFDKAKAAARTAEHDAASAGKEAVSDTARAGGRASASTVDELAAEVDRDLAAERASVARKKVGMSRVEWGRQRAGATKGLYNLLERRAVVNRMRIFPGRTYLEQAEVVGVRSGGRLIRTAKLSTTGTGRIADILELDGTKATLEDLKSPSTQIKSVKGGMSSPDIEAEFRSTSEIAKQHAVEQEVIAEARRSGGKVVVSGRDPLTGAAREIELDPSAIRSRVADYNDIGNN
jgi:hypothetical protein